MCVSLLLIHRMTETATILTVRVNTIPHHAGRCAPDINLKPARIRFMVLVANSIENRASMAREPLNMNTWGFTLDGVVRAQRFF